MAETTQACQACGSPLEIEGNGAHCTNDNCPSGGYFVPCGFCRTYALAVPDKMFCYNPQCRMYKIRRDPCDVCKKPSRISYKGNDVCINRHCPQNTETIDNCFFCKQRDGDKVQKSFLKHPDHMFCTKGSCDHLLVRVDECAFCREHAFNTETKQCDNGACAQHGVTVKPCPQCGGLSFSADAGKCLLPDCAPTADRSRPVTGTASDLTIDMSAGELDKAWQNIFTSRTGEQEAAKQKPATEEQAPPKRPTTGPIFVRRKSEVAEPSAESEPEKQPADAADAEPDDRTAEDLTPRPESDESKKSGGVVFRLGGSKPATAEESPPPAAADQPEPKPKEQPADTSSWVRQKPAAPASATEPAVAADEESDEDLIPSAADVDRLRKQRPAQAEPPSFRPVTGGGKSSVLDAFEFIKEYLLKDGERTHPLYLVIGLAGAGKTTYLTMLGDILRFKSMRYYFPYEGVDINQLSVSKIIERRMGRGRSPFSRDDIKRLEGRIKDLVWDFAAPQFSKYISKMMWAEATAQEEEEGEISTYFLVCELTRRQQVFARLITVETSGEDFQAMMEALRSEAFAEEASTPIQRVLFEMLDLAEGFVVLVSPDNPVNDEIFQNLFLRVRQALEPRAFNNFYKDLFARLQSALGEQSSTGDSDLFALHERMKKRRKETADRTQQREKRKAEIKAALPAVLKRLKEGDESVIEDQRKFLTLLQTVFERLFPEKTRAVQQKVIEAGQTLDAVRSYFYGLVRQAGSNVEAVVLEEEKIRGESTKEGGILGEIPEPVIEKAMKELAEQYGLKDFEVELDPDLASERPVQHMRNLKYLSVVVTKSDMLPIIYPPSQYPEQKLPQCLIFVRAIGNYLKLCGGEIRYYSASATGYSFLRDTLYYPGKENTLTPINIIEPIFDMMNIE